MSEEITNGAAAPVDAATGPAFTVEKIYVKDLSIEVPNAPQVFLERDTPRVDVQLSTKATPVDDGHYEVVLSVTTTATLNDKTVFLVEAHHKFKKDAPSGTALVIAGLMRESYGDRAPEAVAVRAGHIPGTHEVGFDSEADTITLTHTARSREGFAAGAVLAAEKIINKQGVYEFSELLFS